MISTTGLIPEELNYPQRKADVVRFLQAQAWPSEFKRRLLEGWALTVGVRCRSADFAAVEKSGVDNADR
jgi:hypothetical protein